MVNSIQGLRDKADQELGSVITGMLSAGSQPLQRSPELLELIKWNVVIAFGVNLVAGAGWDALKLSWSRMRLRREDLKAHQEALTATFPANVPVNRVVVVAAVKETLLRYNVAVESADDVATRITDVLIEALGKGAP